MNFSMQISVRALQRPLIVLACLGAATIWLAGCGSSMTPNAAGAPVEAPDRPALDHRSSEAVAASPAARSPLPSGSEFVVPSTPSIAPETEEKLCDVDPSRLVGCWRDSFFGTRTLTLNADGTARMLLELDFAGQLLYGRQLDFDMRWSIDGATVAIEILSGRPEKAAKSAMKTWGEVYQYELECVENNEIQMRSSDGSMFHKLQRLQPKGAAVSR